MRDRRPASCLLAGYAPERGAGRWRRRNSRCGKIYTTRARSVVRSAGTLCDAVRANGQWHGQGADVRSTTRARAKSRSGMILSPGHGAKSRQNGSVQDCNDALAAHQCRPVGMSLNQNFNFIKIDIKFLKILDIDFDIVPPTLILYQIL